MTVTWEKIAYKAEVLPDLLSPYAVGDLLYASSTSALSKLAGVAVNQVLVSGGVGAAPAWSGTPTLAGINCTAINPLTTIAESWIGPSSTTGIYFKGGSVGIGTTTPGAKLEVASGNVFFGDTANTFSTQGLTINQAGNDNEILTLKSSDISHSVTGSTEADTFATFKKGHANLGGLRISSYLVNFTAGTQIVNDFQIGQLTVAGANTEVIGTRFLAPVITASSPQTVLNAATLYVSNAPTVAGSASITNSYALWIDNGVARFDGNVGIGTTVFGTSLVTGLALGSGTAPSSFPIDMAQMCVKDQAAGNACFHFYTELGQIIKLYQQAHLADLNAAYGAGDLDTEAEIITAMNLTNAKINSLLLYLENLGFNATA